MNIKSRLSSYRTQAVAVTVAAGMGLSACLPAIPVFSSAVLEFTYEGQDVAFSVRAINGPESVSCATGGNTVNLSKGATSSTATTFDGTFLAAQLAAGQNPIMCTVTGSGNTTAAIVGRIYVVTADNLIDLASDVNLLETRNLTIALPDSGTEAVDADALVYVNFNLENVNYGLGSGTLPGGLSVDAATGNIVGTVSSTDSVGDYPDIVIEATTVVGSVSFDGFTLTLE